MYFECSRFTHVSAWKGVHLHWWVGELVGCVYHDAGWEGCSFGMFAWRNHVPVHWSTAAITSAVAECDGETLVPINRSRVSLQKLRGPNISGYISGYREWCLGDGGRNGRRPRQQTLARRPQTAGGQRFSEDLGSPGLPAHRPNGHHRMGEMDGERWATQWPVRDGTLLRGAPIWRRLKSGGEHGGASAPARAIPHDSPHTGRVLGPSEHTSYTSCMMYGVYINIYATHTVMNAHRSAREEW